EGQFKKLADVLMQELPNIEIELQRKPWGQYWESLEVQVAGGISPDLSFMTPIYLYHFWKAGVVLDVTDLVQRDQLDMSDWVGDAGETRIQGRQYAMPYTNGIEVMYYNADLFDKAGLGYPSKDWTWDDVRVAAQALTGGEGASQQFGIWIENHSEQGWGPLALGNRGWMFSGAVFTDNGGYFEPSEDIKPTLDSPEMMAALTWWIANICELNVQPNAGEFSLAPGLDIAFQSGLIGMYIGGTFTGTSVAQSQFNWNVGYIPRSPNTKERRSPSYAIANIAFKTTKHPEEAWQALKWYSGETAQNILATLGMKEPTLKSALTKLAGPVPDWGNVVLDHYLNFNWNMSTQVFDNVNEATDAIMSALDRAYLCEQSLEQAIAEAQTTAAAALQQQA
ncbi:MAG: ABC transporter substrate-binding protein, partial [Anaerolineae bacterium]